MTTIIKSIFSLLFIFFSINNFAQTIALTSAVGTDNQAVCLNSAITPIEYTIGDGATNVSVTGLPIDITTDFSTGVFTISGSTNSSSNFNYTVTTIGGTGPTATTTGTIVIQSNVTPSFPQLMPVCQGEVNPVLPLNSLNNPPISGTWSPSVVSTSVAGTTTYTFIPTSGQCAFTNVLDVTIKPLPVLVISNPGWACSPMTIDITLPSITQGSSGGVLSYWGNPTCTVPLLNPSIVSDSGTYYIKSTNQGCTDVSSIDVTILSLPNLIVTNPASVNYPSTVDLTDPSILLGSYGYVGIQYYDEYGTLVLNPTTIYCSDIFQIKATSPYGCMSSANVEVTIIGCVNDVDEIQNAKLSIHPNPFNDQIKIALDNNQSSEITISDITGKVVFNQISIEKLIQLDMSNLSSGQYIVTVKSESAIITRKIVK